jgi:hypothetical protein
MQASPSFTDNVYVTLSGYKDNDWQSHLFLSKERGDKWRSIKGDLPYISINDLVIIPNHADSLLFVATDAGVYGSVNGGLNWHKLGTNLPMVAVYDLHYVPEKMELIAGTFGRSINTYNLKTLLEKKYSIKLNFYIDKEATADSYSIEKIKLSEKNKSENIIKLPLLQDSSEIYIQTSEVKKTNPKNKKIQKHGLLEPNQYSEERSKSEVVENTTANKVAKDIETAKIAAQQEDIAPESLINDRTKHVSKSRKRINRRRGNLPRNKNSNNENQSKIVVNDKE